jgi:type IV secretory pathway TraG/TraD family ATPase VirD4
MEGPDSAAALTTALAGMVFEAGTKAARLGPGRRLATPFVSVLDEAANTCRLGELPNWYSHFGSRGMPVLTLIQSWSQGCEVWGERGMTKMWSAANHRWYAGGIAEPEFLRMLSLLIDDRDVERWSTSVGRGGSSRGQSWTREPIMSPGMLAALPKGRALLLSSGNQPTMIRTVPWMAGPWADAVRGSLARFEPGDRSDDRERDTARFVEEMRRAAQLEQEGSGRGIF